MRTRDKQHALKLLMVIIFIVSFVGVSLAGEKDVIRPPKKFQDAIGKKIHFADPTFNPRGNTWCFPFVGAQQYHCVLERGIIFFLPCSAEYYGSKIKKIIYTENFEGGKWVIHYDQDSENYKEVGKDEIKVISIE